MALDYEVELQAISEGYDRKTCWTHARPGIIPPTTAVVTMHELRLTGCDVFYPINDMRSDDLGRTWSAPVQHEVFARRQLPDGVERGVCDFVPGWHKASGKLLGIGQTCSYRDDVLLTEPHRRFTVHSVYDPDESTWSPWQTLAMPDEDHFFNAGAGSAQWLELPNGEILLPIYFGSREVYGANYGTCFKATVMRCEFDGEDLTYVEHGTELETDVPRGFCEPSLTRFGGRFFLTIRNDERGYVACSRDGLDFGETRPWTFDDGSDLGNYNTQQHWVTHSDALFLVYTRRGADNDHVFRHRAPLFMAEVDPDRLCVLRETERIVVPERGARLGNFGVAAVTRDESWVVVTEWMQTTRPDPFDCTVCERYGSDNSVFVARLRWGSPNRLVSW